MDIHFAAPPLSAGVLVLACDDNGARVAGLPTDVLPVAARDAAEKYLAEADSPLSAGKIASLPMPGEWPRLLILAGIGAGTPRELRLAAGAAARAVTDADLAVAVPGLSGDHLEALVEALVLGGYSFRVGGGRSKQGESGDRRALLYSEPDHAALNRSLARARATVWARELANVRGPVKTPTWMGERARQVLTPLGAQVVVRDESWLAEQEFGGVLAVGAGSSARPRLIEAAWRPRGAAPEPHIVLVGKGITFDTGGLNLKPGSSMKMMFTDMAGGAAVLGALHAIAALRLPIRVTALIPAAENSFSGSAYRPSDVIRHHGGRTTEVLNTDAEGRLVLADAMAYAARRLRPTVLVDVATLTGAMKVALGDRVGGILGTDDATVAALIAAGERVGEPLWRLPLIDDYADLLNSDVADAQNAPGSPGGITAALFLRPFAGDVPWAHLDIAGPARAESDDGILARGATGFGVRLLSEWVQAQAR